jgi:hypothetical protein
MLWVVIVVVICAVAIGVSAWWVTEREPTPFGPGENVVERIIEVQAEGDVLHYQEKILWGENQFSEITKDNEGFSSNLITQFEENLSVYGELDEHAVNAKVEFDEKRNSTILTCDVHGATMDSNRFTFFWLLRRFGLDFIDNDFQEPEKGLAWEGFIDNVSTTITIGFPYPIGHCHAHVWPR